MAFRVKPLEMSDQLINHLKALELKLQDAAARIQKLVNEDKNKMKYYLPICDEAVDSSQKNTYTHTYAHAHI